LLLVLVGKAPCETNTFTVQGMWKEEKNVCVCVCVCVNRRGGAAAAEVAAEVAPEVETWEG